MERRPRVCIVSHRLGGYDGVSIEAAKWQRAFAVLGWSVTRAAGYFADTRAARDVVVRGLWADSFGARPPAPDVAKMAHLCRTHDLLILDNVGSLPTTPDAAIAFEEQALRAGTPTIVRHHDPPWQTTALVRQPGDQFPLHDPRMLHITINTLTEGEFGVRYPALIDADALAVLRNTIDVAALRRGSRSAERLRRGIAESEVLLVHPARNITRKNIPAAVRVAADLHRRTGRKVHYWLTDPNGEVGKPPPGVTIHRGHSRCAAELYAAADLVMLTSTWEGWGLPVVEAAAARRPAVTFGYPILAEIHGLGINTVDHTDGARICRLVTDPTSYAALTSANFRAAAALDEGGLPTALEWAAEQAKALMCGAWLGFGRGTATRTGA